MRIIGGTWRSRLLAQPKTADTRPMPDRVKESVFNILASRIGCSGTLPPIDVVDLFAGSGGIGLEALSRGAATCCFVESGRVALATLRQNIETLGAKDCCRVIEADAWTSSSALQSAGRADLVFLDPPYVDSDDVTTSGRVSTFLLAIGSDKAGERMTVLHHRRRVTYEDDRVGGWQVLDRRLMGSNAVTYFSI